jgi:hypothetical protein
MPLPEQKPGTVANIEIKIKEKVAQNGWPILAHFNWPLTLIDPMKEFRESVKALQMNDPRRELRKSLKTYQSQGSLWETIKSTCDDSEVGCGEVRTASFAIDAHHCVQRILRAD